MYGLTTPQFLTLLFVVSVYVAIVVCQVTAGEKWLRSLPRREAILNRLVLSVVHGFLGLFTVATVAAYANIWASGSYREGPFGFYGSLFSTCWVVIGPFIPWLGLLRKKGGGR
jgi:hypothetical protein